MSFEINPNWRLRVQIRRSIHKMMGWYSYIVTLELDIANFTISNQQPNTLSTTNSVSPFSTNSAGNNLTRSMSHDFHTESLLLKFVIFDMTYTTCPTLSPVHVWRAPSRKHQFEYEYLWNFLKIETDFLKFCLNSSKNALDVMRPWCIMVNALD